MIISRKFEKHLKFGRVISIFDCTCERWMSCRYGRWSSTFWPEGELGQLHLVRICHRGQTYLKSLLIKSRSCPSSSLEEDRGCFAVSVQVWRLLFINRFGFLLPVCAETVGKSEKIVVELRIEVWQSCRKNLKLFLSHFHTLNIRRRVESVRETAKRKRP